MILIENLHIVAIVIGLLLTAGGTLVAATWKLSSAVNELKDYIAKARDEIEARQDGKQREIGETVAAIRQRLHDHETWTRDTFVRTEAFHSVIVEFRAALFDLGTRIEKRLERMEEKIDDNHK